jgi:RNA-binding protein FUS
MCIDETFVRIIHLRFAVLQNDRKTNLPRIWIYKDKMSGIPKGEATVTYDDIQTADSAIQWFNGKTAWS